MEEMNRARSGGEECRAPPPQTQGVLSSWNTDWYVRQPEAFWASLLTAFIEVSVGEHD